MTAPQESTPVAWKHDAYRAARGGVAALLRLTCDRCAAVFCLYQKDGPGPLKRLYIDRIHAPSTLAALSVLPAEFRCQCGELIGMPMTYGGKTEPHATHAAEERPAIRLFQATLRDEVVAEEDAS